jgi:hypothetical protein
MVSKFNIDDVKVGESTYVSRSALRGYHRYRLTTLLVVTEREAACLSAVLAISIDTGRAVTTGLICLVLMVAFT